MSTFTWRQPSGPQLPLVEGFSCETLFYSELVSIPLVPDRLGALDRGSPAWHAMVSKGDFGQRWDSTNRSNLASIYI